MALETPDNLYSDGECHMARIANAATFVEQKMKTEGRILPKITSDSIFTLAQEKAQTYPWMDREWPKMRETDKIGILNELINNSWLNDESIILYADKIANGGISGVDEMERQQIVGGAETLAGQALDRMNANGYFNEDKE